MTAPPPQVISPLTPDDIVRDIDGFVNRNAHRSVRQRAINELLLLYARWTNDARAKVANSVFSSLGGRDE